MDDPEIDFVKGLLLVDVYASSNEAGQRLREAVKKNRRPMSEKISNWVDELYDVCVDQGLPDLRREIQVHSDGSWTYLDVKVPKYEVPEVCLAFSLECLDYHDHLAQNIRLLPRALDFLAASECGDVEAAYHALADFISVCTLIGTEHNDGRNILRGRTAIADASKGGEQRSSDVLEERRVPLQDLADRIQSGGFRRDHARRVIKKYGLNIQPDSLLKQLKRRG